jgi:hypothetical protein
MFRRFSLPAFVLSMAFSFPAIAAPPDAPGTVYINGQPCNRACQAYMAWSEQTLRQREIPAHLQTGHSSIVGKPKIRESARTKLAPKSAPARLAKSAKPTPLPNPPQRPVPMLAGPTQVQPDEQTTIKKPQTALPQPDVPHEDAAPPPSVPETTGAAADTPTPAQNMASEPDAAAPQATDNQNDHQLSATAPADQFVAILLVQPEIKTVSDLGSNVVAIDESPLDYSVADIKNAIVAAGGTKVQMSENNKMALMRMTDGEVRAAVVSVLSRTASEAWIAGIRGFNVLRIPLPPSSEKAKRG